MRDILLSHQQPTLCHLGKWVAWPERGSWTEYHGSLKSTTKALPAQAQTFFLFHRDFLFRWCLWKGNLVIQPGFLLPPWWRRRRSCGWSTMWGRAVPKRNTAWTKKGTNVNYSFQYLIVLENEKAYPQVMSNRAKDFMEGTSKKHDLGSLSLLVLLVKLKKGNLFLIYICTYY